MFLQFNRRSLGLTLQSGWQQLQRQLTKPFSVLFAISLSLSLLVSACSPNTTTTTPSPSTAKPEASSTASASVVRIGYQKAATILSLLKEQGDLDKALTAVGATVQWSEFPSGPPMLEAMNAGSVDFGYTGEAPPIFAQAAGTPVRYVAFDPWSPKAEAIVVPKNSPIQKIADLKGKKVGFAKGSNTNYLTVKALESVGLKLTDIQVAHLSPAEGRAAFEAGKIDAWAIWDPFLAVAETAIGARTLVDATNLAPNQAYYLASQSFIDQKANLLKVVLEAVKQKSDWAKANPKDVAKFLAPSLKLDPAPLEKAEQRRGGYAVLPLTDEVIAKQQQIADTFHKINLIPKPIKVQEAVKNQL